MEHASLKTYLQKIPPLYAAVRYLNSVRVDVLAKKREFRRKKRFEHIYRLSSQLMDEFGEEVFNGPFAGMKYPRASEARVHPSKLLGSYEFELRTALQHAVEHGYQRILNVGCADGYYAVGFARACPQAQVFAYDIDDRTLEQCAEHARRNSVENITLTKECTHEELAKRAGESTFLFSDCEGYESELLDPDKCPALLQCDLLIESHDGIVPNITQTLIDRFSATHRHQVLSGTARQEDDFPQLKVLAPADRIVALDELRGDGHCTWLLLERSSS